MVRDSLEASRVQRHSDAAPPDAKRMKKFEAQCSIGDQNFKDEPTINE